MSKIRHFFHLLPENWDSLLLFFSILLVSIFLGDGKQTIIDLFIASGILVLYGVWRLRRKKFKPLPPSVACSWAILIGYYLVRTFFSDSVGYSISGLIRMLEAFLVYRLFFAMSSEAVLKLYTKFLLVLGTFAAGLSVLFLFTPGLTNTLPSMNLVYASYGHNHLADLLLLVLPLVVRRLAVKHRWSLVLFFFLLLAMILTLARGAILLLALYLIWETMSATRLASRQRLIGLGSCAVLLVGLVVLVTILSITNPRPTVGFAPPGLVKQLIKSAPVDERRFDYWRQAISAIRERPWFGSGPGTFFLQSLRFQRLPQSYSWFAHSFPLQVAVEVGVVGLVLLGILLTIQGVFIRSGRFLSGYSSSDTRYLYVSPLLIGLWLTMVYSFYEFNLDFLLIWVLFWSGLGVLGGIQKEGQSPISSNTSWFALGAVILLGMFYISATSSALSSLMGQRTMAFLLAPYDTSQTLKYIKSLPTTSGRSIPYLDLMQLMHARNPEILQALAQNAQNAHDYSSTKSWYRKALEYDPKNIGYRLEYLEFLENNRLYEDMAQELIIRGAYGLSGRWTIVLYDHGYREVLQKNYAAALPFWSAAAAASPTWSHPAIELASLQLVLDDSQGARATLTKCSTNIHAGRHCQMALEWLQQKSFPAPGSLAKEISPNH